MDSPQKERPAGLWLLRVLLVLAALAALTASAVVIVFLADAPESGTSLYDTLGTTAAISGIAATGLFAFAAVWAVARGLWRHVRLRLRFLVFVSVLTPLVAATVAIATVA